jgi:hypothetical protein
VPKAKVVFYQDQDGSPSVLEWLKTLLKEDRKGYANCVARIQQLAKNCTGAQSASGNSVDSRFGKCCLMLHKGDRISFVDGSGGMSV